MSQKVRILVVDDDFRVAAVHADALAQLDRCEVVGRATTLGQARQVLSSTPVDLVVADEYLPDGSGSDLVGAADAAVIMVTASDAPATVRRALLRGAFGYILKPFAMPVLIDRVTAFVRYHDAVSAERPRTQADIDALISHAHPRSPGAAMPKGRSAVTANAIAAMLRDSDGPVTAVAVADGIGISRATAQRYLSDMVAEGSAELALRYGTTGRPEHSYAWVAEAD